MMRNLKIFEDTMSARIGDYREIGDEAVVKIASEMQEDYLRKKQAALACKENDKNSYVLKMRTALKVLNDFDEFHKQLKEKKP